ncbi:hypothetical protein BFL38_00680 [Brachyspira hampsonii]|uniref:Glycoside hydrolase family 19 catalytic domain-containing protein n=1 Tax=Brachyspira hampsonii TaxID=1287055 RepID=A0A1E5NAD5_9SPIR|nr:hypothetical protein [Brachyspira hampsonii]OEJ13112.1 hypothetical protein BFL38_00680 [Brachyspira hampsonii]
MYNINNINDKLNTHSEEYKREIESLNNKINESKEEQTKFLEEEKENLNNFKEELSNSFDSKIDERIEKNNFNYNNIMLERLENAKKLCIQGAEAIGNFVYGGRLGNGQDEGYKYRGRGIIQLTGKNNYKNYGKSHFLFIPILLIQQVIYDNIKLLIMETLISARNIEKKFNKNIILKNVGTTPYLNGDYSTP